MADVEAKLLDTDERIELMDTSCQSQEDPTTLA
jgi:hypothetical protein